MATTWKLLETWDGTREQTSPDPENEGETKTETLTGITDIKVLFTCTDKTPKVEHERMVNVVLDSDGNYDETAMKERLDQVAMGVANKIACNAIS